MGRCPCHAVLELEVEDGVDLIWVEWRRRRGDAVAAKGGRASVGGGAAGEGECGRRCSDGDPSWVGGGALDISLGKRRRAGGAFD
jgi:hypothetical protein